MGPDNTERLVTGHRWSKDSALLQVRTKASGRTVTQFKKLDFSALGINVNGILAHCVRDSSAPMHASVARALFETLKTVAPSDSEFRRILGEPPENLTTGDITYALTVIDAHFEKKKIKSGAALAEKTRNFILTCQSPLANNILAKQVHYASTLQVAKRTPRKDIPSEKLEGIISQPIKPSEAIHVQTESEFQKIAKKHYEGTLEPIIKKCVGVLDIHSEIQLVLDCANRSSLPANLAKRTVAKFDGAKKNFEKKVVKRRNAHDRLIMALAVVKRNSLHINAPAANQIFIEGIPVLSKLSGNWKSRAEFGVLLSLHYLSRYVVTACYIILLFYTRWNTDTLISVTAKRVKRTPHGYEISSHKSKTSSNQNTEIVCDDDTTYIEEVAAVRALELLLWHDANVSLNAKRLSPSIFVSMRLSYHNVHEFDVFLSADDFHEFTSAWDLPRFTGSDIRPNAERYDYLKRGMHIENSRVVLGHKKESTSRTYVDGDIARNINEAMIIRYQAMLAHAIRFQTGRASVPSEFSQKQKETIQSLLLPPTRFSNNTDDYLVDKWLANPTNFSFVVGPAEVEQCVRQRRYYLKNMQALRKANSDRFIRSDIPRILVCLALYNLIKASPYSRFCEEVEREIDVQI